MTDANFLFNNAELAFASYASLQPGLTGGAVNIEALQTPSGNGMTSTQATKFALRYPDIIAQFNDTPAEGGMGTSFSVTVFKDTVGNSAGNITIAFRGTLEINPFGTPNDILPTDANIFVEGAGYDQIVAMYNWWKREGSEGGLLVDQYQIVSRSREELPPANSVPLYVDPENGYFLVVAPAVVANGGVWNALNADSDGKIDLTGHSLGGHLAMAFNKLFAGIVSQVTVFNAPGFIDSTFNQEFFGRLGGVVPTPDNSGSVLNIKADETDIGQKPWNGIAGWHSRPGIAIDIPIEDQSFSDEPISTKFGALNHSQVALTDSLAVYHLLVTLAPSITTTDYKAILGAAALGTAASYERIVDALEKLIGTDRWPMPVGNDQRDTLYRAISTLHAAINDRGLFGAVSILPITTIDAASLVESANGLSDAIPEVAIAYRYALKELNPFIVTGNSGLYAIHNSNGELDFYNPGTRAGSLTADWIADRAAFFTWKNLAYRNDITALNGQISEHYRFIDLSQNINITAVPTGAGTPVAALTRRFVFGGDGGDVLTGGEKSDRLYGGGGIDYLAGKKDDDYLEGGAGRDIYEYNGYDSILGTSNDGADLIRDIEKGTGVEFFSQKDACIDLS
jgi:hypothetical protein